MAAPEQRRRVTLRNTTVDAAGRPVILEGVDHVAPEHIDAYVEEHRARGWRYIEIGDDNDHGPGGPRGAYRLHDDVVRRLPEHVRKTYAPHKED